MCDYGILCLFELLYFRSEEFMKIKTSAVFDGNTFEGARSRLIAFTAYTVIALFVAFIGSTMTFSVSYKELGLWMVLVSLGYILVNGIIFVPMVHSKSYATALIGHLCVAFSTGLFIGPFCSANSANLFESMAATGAITLSMTGIGLLYPKFFAGLGRYLVAALLLFIFWMIGSILLQVAFGIIFTGHLTSWLGIGIFSLFIAHHVGMVVSNDLDANEVVAESCGMFLSIINLLLHVVGVRSSDD